MKEHRCSNFSRKEKQQQQQQKNKQTNKQTSKIVRYLQYRCQCQYRCWCRDAAAEISKWLLSSYFGLSMLIMSTFTMNVIYIRQSSGTVLINIPEQKKKNTQI